MFTLRQKVGKRWLRIRRFASRREASEAGADLLGRCHWAVFEGSTILIESIDGRVSFERPHPYSSKGMAARKRER